MGTLQRTGMYSTSYYKKIQCSAVIWLFSRWLYYSKDRYYSKPSIDSFARSFIVLRKKKTKFLASPSLSKIYQDLLPNSRLDFSF
jgi:hypothetical protein